MSENTIEELKALQDDAMHEMSRELEHLDDMRAQVESRMKVMGATNILYAEIENLKRKLEEANEDRDALRQQLQEERESKQTIEMRLSELTKLSAGVAKKSPQDDLLKALRTFVNKSKQKRLEKRAAIKEMVLELANANGIILPEDFSATIDALDDEEPKSVTVSGDYVINKNVKYEVDNVPSGSTGIAVNE